MKRVLILATLALFGISTLTTSCIVSKKKYNTAVANGRRSLDSLNRVFNKTVEGFNQATNSLKTNNSSKDITLDSLIRENQKLAGDKATLNQNLINSINEFNEERAKLARKTRTADSLMNILALQSEAQDSIRNLDEGRQHQLETMLMTINKALTGINQSDAKAKIAGPGIIVTISNDYLYKTAKSPRRARPCSPNLQPYSPSMKTAASTSLPTPTTTAQPRHSSTKAHARRLR